MMIKSTRLIVCFMIIISVALSGCSTNNSGSNQSSSTSTETSSASTVEASTSEMESIDYSGYDELIAEVREARLNPDNVDTKMYEKVSSALFMSHSFKFVGYAIMDINGDGIKELMFGQNVTEDDYGYVYTIYTIKEGNPFLIFNGAERFSVGVCENGILQVGGSSGALSGTEAYYKFSGQSFTSETTEGLIECIIADGFKDENNPWFYSTTSLSSDNAEHISAEKAQEIRDKYKFIRVEFTPFYKEGDPLPNHLGNSVQVNSLSDAGCIGTYECKDYHGNGVTDIFLKEDNQFSITFGNSSYVVNGAWRIKNNSVILEYDHVEKSRDVVHRTDTLTPTEGGFLFFGYKFEFKSKGVDGADFAFDERSIVGTYKTNVWKRDRTAVIALKDDGTWIHPTGGVGKWSYENGTLTVEFQGSRTSTKYTAVVDSKGLYFGGTFFKRVPVTDKSKESLIGTYITNTWNGGKIAQLIVTNDYVVLPVGGGSWSIQGEYLVIDSTNSDSKMVLTIVDGGLVLAGHYFEKQK